MGARRGLTFIAGPNGTPDNHLREVWLDGRREALAIRADAGEGWVERYVTERGGLLLRQLGKPLTEIVFGRVEIRRGW